MGAFNMSVNSCGMGYGGFARLGLERSIRPLPLGIDHAVLQIDVIDPESGSLRNTKADIGAEQHSDAQLRHSFVERPDPVSGHNADLRLPAPGEVLG